MIIFQILFLISEYTEEVTAELQIVCFNYMSYTWILWIPFPLKRNPKRFKNVNRGITPFRNNRMVSSIKASFSSSSLRTYAFFKLAIDRIFKVDSFWTSFKVAKTRGRLGFGAENSSLKWRWKASAAFVVRTGISDQVQVSGLNLAK